MQVVARLPEPPKSGEGSSTPPGAIGASTGSEGPDLQPMRPGLPNTPIEACRELMLAIVAQALADSATEYLSSPRFILDLLFVGLGPDMAVKIQSMYMRGEINSRKLKTALYCSQ